MGSNLQQRPTWLIYIQLPFPTNLSLIVTIHLMSILHLWSRQQRPGASGSCHKKVSPFLEYDKGVGVKRK